MRMQLRRGTVALVALIFLTAACSLPAGLAGAADAVVATATVPGSGNVEGKWPRVFQKDGNVVELFPPQIDEWKDHKKIKMRMAMSVLPKDAKESFFGVLELKAKTELEGSSRMVLMTDFEKSVRFNGVKGDQEDKLKELVRDLLPQRQSMEVSLDRIVACLELNKNNLKTVDVNMAPPTIHRSESPAILLIFLGPPQLKPIPNTRLMFAMNANWPVLFDQESSRYFLLNEEAWLVTADPIKGPWEPAQALPAEFSKLPDTEEWADVRKNMPAKPAKAAVKVFACPTPAELIVTNGAPAYTPLTGTRLLYVSNPTMPLFLDTADSCYYYLVAGRWFRAKTVDGPWAAASTDLPKEFALIPESSPVGYVLASVPGTQQAKDALLLASVPQKATVKRSEAKVEVIYQGAPKFVVIEGTKMTYAVNTPFEVICVKDKYYCCYNGVWFVGPVATGPWVVCTDVPSVIYTIPPSCPVYNVTYVNVYESTEDTVVVGHTSGYSGEYVAATGVLMFGAGLVVGALWADHHDWWYPYPCFYSYGFGATYHWGYGGFYGCGARYYGPYGGAGYVAGYNPATGTYFRKGYAYGPGGGRYVTQAYNPYTDRYGMHSGGYNGYQSWGHTVVAGPNGWVSGGHVSGPGGRAGYVENSQGQWARRVEGSEGGGAFRTSGGAEGIHGNDGGIAKTKGGDVYAGKDGNAYRNTGNGWEKYDNGGWTPVTKPTGASEARANAESRVTTAGGDASARAERQPERQSRTGEASTGLDRERATRNYSEQNASRWQGGGAEEGSRSSRWENREGHWGSGASAGSSRSWSGGGGFRRR